LDADNQPCDPQVRHNLVLPFVNPRIPGHEAPNTSYIMRLVLEALYADEFPPLPVHKEGGVWETHDGQLITDSDEITRLKEERADAVLAKCKDLWVNPDQLLEEVFYARVKQNGRYRNLDELSAEPPVDEEVQTNPEEFKDYSAS